MTSSVKEITFECYKSGRLKRTVGISAIVILALCFVLQIIPLFAFADNDGYDDWFSDDDSAFAQTYNQCLQQCIDKSGLSAFAFYVSSIGRGLNPVVSVTHFGKDILQIRNVGIFTYTDTNNNQVTKNLWDYAANAYDALRVAGITLMLLYFFLSIIDKITSEQLTAELFIRKLLALAICLIIILNGVAILNGIMAWTDDVIVDVDELMGDMAGDAGSEVLRKIANRLADPDYGFIKTAFIAIGEAAGSIIDYLFQLAMVCIVFMVGVSRTIEIFIRYMFAPIGIAPLVHDGMRSSGARYIKKFAACCLNGAIIVAIAMLVTVMNAIFASAGGFVSVVSRIAFPIAAIALVFRCQNIADEIIGVH